MQNQLLRIKVHAQCYIGLRFFKNLANTLQNVLMWSNKDLIFGLKRCGHKATEKRKAKNHKLPLSRHFLKSKMSSLVKTFTRNFPLFSTDSQLSTRMLIFRKQTRKQRIFFSLSPCLPLAKYLDFYDVSKNSEHIKTF
jgi:hypothetical protein